MASIERADIKPIIKEALDATGGVQYPDLLNFIAQRLLREVLDDTLQRLEKKGLIERSGDDMGTIISKSKKKGNKS